MEIKPHNPMRRPLRVRIPFLNRSEDHAPIQECVMYAAEKAGIDSLTVATVMSLFFEEIAEHVADNKIVRIPGFGAFGPKTRFRKVPSKFTGDLSCAYPAFVPSSSFKREVRFRVPPSPCPQTDRMRRLARNNSFRAVDGTESSLADVFRNIREALATYNDDSARSQRQRIR
jgi:nucleoid DNA-binding protein